jgi:hypothetical protein
LTPYWIAFLLTAIMSLDSVYKRYANLIWGLLFIFFLIFIGLRHEVGGDWGGYLRRYNEAGSTEAINYITRFEIGFMFLNWVAYQLGGGIYMVNTVCASIFFGGLISFCRKLPLSFLAFTVAIPYMVIVVSAGYTRQSVALGLAMFAFGSISEGRFVRSMLYIVLATLFHKTAIILLPLVILYESKNFWLRLFSVASVSVLIVVFFLLEKLERLWVVYVEIGSQSDGAMVRLIMIAIPGIILIMNYSKMKKVWKDSYLWLIVSLLSIALIPLALGPMSTAVDRIALYFLPLQMVVFSRFPILISDRNIRTMLIIGIILYYALVQFVWLNYSNFSAWWVPYQNYFVILPKINTQ